MERVTLYNIRRGVANNLVPLIPLAYLMKAMGHVDPSTLTKYYQSSTLNIDFQGLWLRKEQDSTIDFGSISRMERGSRPPTRLPANIKARIDEGVAHLEAGSREFYSAKEYLKKKAWSMYIKHWHSNFTVSEVVSSSSSLVPDSCDLRGDLRDERVVSRLKLEVFTLDHGTIKQAFFTENFNMRDNNFQLLRIMVAIIQEPRVEQHVHFYPDSRPIRTFTATGVEYSCEWCGKDITQSVHLTFPMITMLTTNSMTPSYRPNHLYTCYREAVKRQAGQTPQYCHRCNIWFPRPFEYREHCRRHFIELDMFCGLVKEK
jgi:hypothetical protein